MFVFVYQKSMNAAFETLFSVQNTLYDYKNIKDISLFTFRLDQNANTKYFHHINPAEHRNRYGHYNSKVHN